MDASTVFEEEFGINEEQSKKGPGVIGSIRLLVHGQKFCVLSTQGNTQPYASLIAYSYTPDLKHFFFTTARETRKFTLLSQCRRVALLIDSRCLHQHDLTGVEALTITGYADNIGDGTVLKQGMELMRQRHPYLSEFLEADTTALFRVHAVRFLHVTRFQEVSQWVP